MEDNIVELGVDINTDWVFKNGDLVLVDNEENIIQAIINRLNCEYDGLDGYYYEYGTLLSSFLGFDANNETLEFMKIEVEETLQQDPRLNDFEVELEYNKNGDVEVHIHIQFTEESDLSFSLILDDEGTVLLNDEGDDIGD